MERSRLINSNIGHVPWKIFKAKWINWRNLKEVYQELPTALMTSQNFKFRITETTIQGSPLSFINFQSASEELIFANKTKQKSRKSLKNFTFRSTSAEIFKIGK